MELPATELAVRDWLRADSGLVSLVGGDPRRIDVDYSGDQNSTHMTMYRAGGAPVRLLPLDACFMGFDCWGKGRGAALNLQTYLVNKLVNSREQFLNETTYLRGCEVFSVLWLPDSTGQPRYAVTARITASARQAVA